MPTVTRSSATNALGHLKTGTGSALVRFLLALVRPERSMLVGAVLAVLVMFVRDRWARRKQLQAEFLWRRHVDLSVVQACIISTEHLASLGRVEKRTLFVKPISEVFRNEYILARVLECAERAATKKEPMMMTELSPEDKWHVLNTCTNHLSACFAPYHVFFNEARRASSYYKSAWYCFTLTCAQTAASGRWFITPLKPVGVEDVGMLRIRIVMMNEQELRDISSGAIEPPSFGFFNGRHESRWNVCTRFAELFGRQVMKVTNTDDVHTDWGPNLCGRLSKHRDRSSLHGSHSLLAGLAGSAGGDHHGGSPPTPQYGPEDNAILRIHIPFPTSRDASLPGHPSECVSNNVVLYE